MAKKKSKASKKKAPTKKKAAKKKATKKAAPKKKAKASKKKAPTKKASKKKATKKAAPKKAAPKKKKAAPKKKKAAPKKKKAAPKKAASKKKKAAPKKAAAKKKTTKKAAPKKAAAKKKAAPKKAVAKKKATKKAAPKKAAAKKTAPKTAKEAAPKKKAAKKGKVTRVTKAVLPDPDGTSPLPFRPADEGEAILADVLRCQRMGDFSTAQRHLKAFAARFPRDIRHDFYSGNLLRAQGDRKAALKAFKAALRKDARAPEALWWKAEFHLQNPEGELKDAEACLKKLLEVTGRKRDPDSQEWSRKAKDQLRFCQSRHHALQSRALLHKSRVRTADLRKARALLEKAVKAYPEDARNHMSLGSVELMLGNHQGTVDRCLDAIDHNPAYARAHLILGHAYRELGKLRLSVDAYLNCIELDKRKRDVVEAWKVRREVEHELAQVRRRVFATLARRVSDDGDVPPLDLGQLKSSLSVLEGVDLHRADLQREEQGDYALTGYGSQVLRASAGPEGLVVERT